MKNIKNTGRTIILGVWPGVENPQQIIERAGRTYYPTEKKPITHETASEFICMLKQQENFSIIGHAWIGFILPQRKLDYIKYFQPYSKFLFQTKRKRHILISANLETWKKIYLSGKLNKSNLTDHLFKFCPDIFSVL